MPKDDKSLAADVADVDITPKDIVNNPAKVAKKIVGMMEMGAGATLNGIVDGGFKRLVKHDIARDVIEMLGGMLASGSVNQNDISNVLAGFAVAPAARFGTKLYNAIIEFARKRRAPAAVAPTAAPAGSKVTYRRPIKRTRGYGR